MVWQYLQKATGGDFSALYHMLLGILAIAGFPGLQGDREAFEGKKKRDEAMVGTSKPPTGSP